MNAQPVSHGAYSASPNRDASAPYPTARLAEWIAGLRHADLPQTTRSAVRAALLDTLGVGLYGLNQPWTQIVRAWAERDIRPSPQRETASIWGDSSPRLRPGDAALVNGVSVHAFELDDYHNAKVHPGAAVIPAAIALGQVLDASGEALETAIAAGYEVMIRTALALEPSTARLRGWHLTGVAGPLGAAAAAAVLLRLDAERTAWALGLAGTQASGLFAFNADGAMSKRFHPGRAAQSGIMAAELAQMGLTGPTRIYEAEDGGLLRALSDAPRPEQLTVDLGERFFTDTTSFKPYACCGSLHAYLDAALQLRPLLDASDPAAWRVRAGMSRVIGVQCGYDYHPGTELNAQMSARYCIAVALLEGEVLPAQFAPGKLSDPRVVDLAQRLDLVSDAALDELYPKHFVGWVEAAPGPRAELQRAYVLDPSGSTANPDRENALIRKFRALARGLPYPQAAPELERAVAELPQTPARRLMTCVAALYLNR